MFGILPILSLFFVCNGETQQRPNIIFMFADDWGYNDVGYHGNTNTQTTFLDKLATEESIILSNNYVTPLCTISRASFLTGRYPFRHGMQHYVLRPNSKYALSRQESLISNEFQNAGYMTHMIGKWHLGMIANEYTPNYRGFDTFHGYYLGKSHYYTHTYELTEDEDSVEFKDLRINMDPAGDEYDDIYGPYWQRDRILELLQSKTTHTNNNPFFMYIGWQASHLPSESPEELFNLYYNPDDEDNEIKLSDEDLDDSTNNWVRRFNMQAQTTSLDTVMEEIITYMKENGLWDNTLIVFSSDNGGESDFGDNAPLRGSKNTLWEGGIKVPAFITGGIVPKEKRGSRFDDISYVCDWYPTLLSIAGIVDYSEFKQSKMTELIKNSLTDKVDGVNLHPTLFGLENSNENVFESGLSEKNVFESGLSAKNEAKNSVENVFESGLGDEIKNNLLKNVFDGSEREIVLQMGNYDCDYSVCGAIRYGDYKFLIGGEYIYYNDDNIFTGFWDRRYATDSDSDSRIDAFQCGAAPLTVYDLGYETDDDFIASDDYDDRYKNGEIRIEYYNLNNNCDSENGCLFDLNSDPCEYNDIGDSSEVNEAIAEFMKERLMYYQSYEALSPLYDNYGTYDVTGFDDEENLPPMVDEEGYWAPWVSIGDIPEGEMEFETYLRDEKSLLSEKLKEDGVKEKVVEKILSNNNNNKDRTFLGTSSRDMNAFNFGNGSQIRGVFYAFLVILIISMILCGFILYRRREEWKERQKRRGSALLRRYTVNVDEQK